MRHSKEDAYRKPQVGRPNKEDVYRMLKREAKTKGIEVNTLKYNPIVVVDIPAEHMEKFAHIQTLGRTSFLGYGCLSNGENSTKPWQSVNKQKARKLMTFAARCREENRNESGWRYDVEQRLFERFDIEVACKNCRNRLWRSEIEAVPSSRNSRATSLEDRQSKRKSCTCDPNDRMVDNSALDSGISDIFSSRIEEACLGPDPSARGSLKRPDRIHGLQRTSKFDAVLGSPYAHDPPQRNPPRLVEDLVRTTLNPDNGGSPLLFPFLVVEAKREKGADNFEQMEIQTAFPIKHALKLQYDLMQTRGNTMDVPGGPLVWFLANRGEDWRVYAGHVHDREGVLKYRINHLWGGSITGLDDALQLILIVDYIMDWARDIFRPSMLRQLETLVTADRDETMTCAFDPDVYSTRREVQSWVEAQDIGAEELLDATAPGISVEGAYDNIHDPLEQFRTEHGVVKDARQINSCLRGLLITRDNLETILQSFENPDGAIQFVQSIITLLSHRCIALEGEAVFDAVEDHWTGSHRVRSTRLRQRNKFYAQFRISYYINPLWEQVRELTYLAATDDAWELLIQRAGHSGIVKRFQLSLPECSRDDLIYALDRLRQNSVRQDLVSSLRRRTYMLEFSKPRMIRALDTNGALHMIDKGEVVAKQDKKEESPGVQMQGIVHAIYEKHRIGNREPCEPFLRASSQVDADGRALWRGWKDGDTLLSTERHLDKILVQADLPDAENLPDGAQQKYCLYIMDGHIDQLSNLVVAAKLIWHLYEDTIYSTVRKAEVFKTGRNWQDNRDDYWFSMKVNNSRLKTSREQLRQGIESWKKAIAAPEESASTNSV